MALLQVEIRAGGPCYPLFQKSGLLHRKEQAFRLILSRSKKSQKLGSYFLSQRCAIGAPAPYCGANRRIPTASPARTSSAYAASPAADLPHPRSNGQADTILDGMLVSAVSGGRYLPIHLSKPLQHIIKKEDWPSLSCNRDL